jgi:hypothetical protein
MTRREHNERLRKWGLRPQDWDYALTKRLPDAKGIRLYERDVEVLATTFAHHYDDPDDCLTISGEWRSWVRAEIRRRYAEANHPNPKDGSIPF